MSSSAKQRSGVPLRLAASWLLGLGFAGAATIAPAVAEAQLDARLRDRLGLDDAFTVDINLSNIEMRALSRVLPGGHTRLSAQRVYIRPTFDGVFIELEGLHTEAVAPLAAEPRETRDAAAGAKNDDDDARVSAPDPLTSLLQRLRGIPLDVRHDGLFEFELEAGLTLRAQQLHIELPGDGQLFAAAEVAVGPSEGPAYLDTKLSFSTSERTPRQLVLEGSVLDEAKLPLVSFTGAGSPARVELELSARDGESAELVATSASEHANAQLRITANDFPLAGLASSLDALVERFAPPAGGLLQLESSRATGTVELELDGTREHLRLEDVELASFAVEHDLFAPRPVHFDRLSLDGELGHERGPAGATSFATLLLAHRGVALEASGQLSPTGLSFELQLPESPCQAVFDATPGLSPVLAGTEFEGELGARVGLELDFAELARARAEFAADEGASFDLETFEPPGQLRFDLPYLERCTVTRLGPGIDIEGLRGAYRHDFDTGSGSVERRVLAHGDEGFVQITAIPTLALAFVILEDAMFHRHDGFDREQIERAFWFNLLEGHVRRGASTISQQTARTLWLGIDRSITRKLAEAMLTAELERGLGKRRILEIYLNLIELGPGVHGVAEAAEYHFGKPAQKLTLIEALHLASLAPAPVAYSRRFASGELDEQWREHLRLQVRRLQLRKLVSREQAQRAQRLDLDLRPH